MRDLDRFCFVHFLAGNCFCLVVVYLLSFSLYVLASQSISP